MSFSGEWWIDESGDATYADGDVGDVSHESMAWEWILESFGIDTDRLYDDLEKVLTPGDELDEGDEVYDYLVEVQKVDPGDLDEISGLRDAREYMINNIGWIRVKDNNFDMYAFTDSTLENMRDFIGNEMGYEEGDPEWDGVEVYIEERALSTGFDVPIEDLMDESKTAGALKYRYNR